MADAFTANLNLNKQEVGQHLNTWGTILNTDLAYIDSKFGDRTTINSTGGTTTLTETEQKVNVIKLTGTLASAVTIAFNATGGTWIIDNQMVQGAFAVTVKVTGQTGFTLTALGKSVVYYDGTDIVAAAIPPTGLGVVGIANGGTGQITAAAAALVLAPSVAAAFAAKKSVDQSVATTASTIVTFDTETYDVGGHFASNAWTPPSGKILLSSTVYFAALAASSTCTVSIFKNGVIFKAVGTQSVGAGFALSITCFDIATGTDVYGVRITSTDSAYQVISISVGSVSTWFEGIMV